jgi:cation transport protein ChaC
MRTRLVLTPELVSRVERKIAQETDPQRVPMSDADYQCEATGILDSHDGGPLWVFGYGSLLWNPGFDFEERRPAHLRGWHRAFCMKLNRFRGSEDQPGLMLGLDHGGSCKGGAFRVAEVQVAAVVDKLLRREVPYRRRASAWRWVEVDLQGKRQRALTFYAGMRRDLYYVRLPIHAQAHMLARAAGHGGSGAAYLHHTVMKLEELGIHDSYLWELQHLVAAEIRAMYPDLAGEFDAGS